MGEGRYYMPCVLPTMNYMYTLPDTSCALYVEYKNTFRTVHRGHGIFYGIAVQHSGTALPPGSGGGARARAASPLPTRATSTVPEQATN